jgi:hypothetical protein
MVILLVPFSGDICLSSILRWSFYPSIFIPFELQLSQKSPSKNYAGMSYFGRAVGQAFRRPCSSSAAEFDLRSGRVGFVVDEVVLWRIFSQYFGSLAGFQCTNLSTFIIHPQSTLRSSVTDSVIK